MPKMRGPSGQVRDLSYDEDGEKKAKELEGKGWKRVKSDRDVKSGATIAGAKKQMTRYQLGGLVHRTGPKRVRTKSRGTGAATRGLDFYKG